MTRTKMACAGLLQIEMYGNKLSVSHYFHILSLPDGECKLMLLCFILTILMK